MTGIKNRAKLRHISLDIEKVKEFVDVSLVKITIYIVSVLVFSALIVATGIKAYNLSVENRWLKSQIKEMRFTLENLTEEYYNLSSRVQSINLNEK